MRWWLVLATASIVGYLAFGQASIYYAPQRLGLSFITRDGQTFVSQVVPGSRASAAGIRPGDRIVSGSGLRIADDSTVRVLIANLPASEPVTWELSRGGNAIVAVTAPAGRSLARLGAFALVSVMLTISATLGLVVMWRRANDTNAVLAAWFLAGIACSTSPSLPQSMAATWRGLPMPVGALMWPAFIASFSVPMLLFALFARMRRRGISWPILLVALTPGAALVMTLTVFMMLVVYAPDRAVALRLPFWFRIAAPLMYPAYFIAAVALLAPDVRRTDDLTEARRARILVAGGAVGCVGLIGLVTGTSIAAQAMPPVAVRSVLMVSVLLFVTLPASFTYAMLRYRLFDFRVIIRIGVQYTIARGALLALVPFSVALLAADVARHSDESVRHILSDRGWTYLLFGTAALVGHVERRRWLTALDRRFFRERYVAQEVLHQIVDDLANARRLDTIASLVLGQIVRALRPRSASLLIRPAGARRFETLVRHCGSVVPPLEADSAIAHIVRVVRKPLTLAVGREGIRRDLPRKESEWLCAADVELLVPVATGDAAREVLIALGPRLSEEPYSGEDVELLTTIAASLAIVEMADANRRVPSGGDTLAAADRRALAGRYRLDRRLGEGGMGVVWEAHDNVLGRTVAVKRLKTADGPGQVDGFKHEAQAAARLVHPNVVVVHDYGVDDEGRPFLVMERLLGRTLRQRLQVDGRLAPPLASAVVTGAAAGVAAAHAQQLIHRDLKPENVFLCGDAPESSVKILDFGIARALPSGATTTHAAASGTVAGTLRYMAPEQLAGGQPSPLWDVWALGVIAYEAITGAHPLASASPIAYVSALLVGKLEPVRTHLLDAPAAWDAFFNRALALDPAARPQSAVEFEREFVDAILQRLRVI